MAKSKNVKQLNDHYFKLAKQKGYLARSVFKLQEINDKFKILKKNYKILDLGAAPGSWSQYVLEVTKGHCSILGVDLKPIEMKSPFASGFKAIQGSFNIEEVLEQIKEKGPYDLIISDAAPSTSGDRFVDACSSAELAETVLDIAGNNLKQGGNVVIKIFQGGAEIEVMDRIKSLFTRFKAFKPKASKNESFETFYIGFEYK